MQNLNPEANSIKSMAMHMQERDDNSQPTVINLSLVTETVF